MDESTKYNNGEYSWVHGQVISRHPNGNLDRWLLGPCPECGSTTSNYGGLYSCHSLYCTKSSNVFACTPGPMPDWWNTGVNVMKDGNKWFAHGVEFINLQESISGWGKTPREAVEDYLKELEAA